jgi:hypothetical protein
MGWLVAIQQFFKIVFFFLDLKAESNKKKAKEKAEIGKEIVDALAETNKARRASHLSAAVVKLRK